MPACGPGKSAEFPGDGDWIQLSVNHSRNRPQQGPDGPDARKLLF